VQKATFHFDGAPAFLCGFGSAFPFDGALDPDFYLHCCGSGIFILDPGSGILILDPGTGIFILDPGSEFFHPGSRIRINEIRYYPKKMVYKL